MMTQTTNNTHASTTALLCAEDPLIDMAFITTYTGMTDKWFYQLISDGKFPKPIKLGRSSRWYKSDVETWMQQRIAASRGTWSWSGKAA
ncbi:transcriptional regulator [Enterobacter ludwigii]|jgi:prophage regulatory protein|nr:MULTISPECIES: AlpA family transcriptional regulator [Enterobacteriaceae]AHE69281.1 transcriptional regulator [Enterobacter ludwigii]MCU6244152.1 AlpA family transcriptional regulator [Enterobacter asburiae]